MSSRRRTSHGVVRTELDGVPSFWPVEAVPGPLSAALVFRVGQADETLPTRGVTHLVEHLALARTPWGAHDVNGATSTTTTTFTVTGEAEQVREYLREVTASLGDLPVERLEHERQVLRTEEAGRSTAASALWRMRWGPQGPGLVGYDELGLNGLQEGQVVAWAHEHFVRERAVLMLSGPPPRGGLTLGLRDGTPPGEVPIPPTVDALPAFFLSSPGGFGLSWTADRSAAARAGSWLLGIRLADRLRRRDGLVYGLSADSDPLTPSLRHEALWTGCLPENASAAGAAVLEVLDELRDDGRWTAEEEDRYRGMLRANGAGAGAGYVAYLALARLTGDTPLTPRKLEADLAALGPDDVAEALGPSLETLLLALPDDLPVPEKAARPVLLRSRAAVPGRELVPAHGQATTLVVGSTGISEVGPDGCNASVLFADCRAVLAWDDGARTLLGGDGFAVAYRPEQWRDDGRAVTAQLDAAVPAELQVPVGTRESLADPRPPDPWARPVAVVRAAGLAFTVLMTVFMLALTVTLFGEAGSKGDRVLGVLLGAAFTGATGAWPAYELRKTLRVRRHRDGRD